MYTLVIVIHIVICFFLVCSVLLQKGKGAEIGAVFGSSEALFGSTGPITFMNKFTSVVAVLFMITSLTLTYLSAHKGTGSVMEDVAAPAPATTAPAPQAPSSEPATKAPTPPGETSKALQPSKQEAADQAKAVQVPAQGTRAPAKDTGGHKGDASK